MKIEWFVTHFRLFSSIVIFTIIGIALFWISSQVDEEIRKASIKNTAEPIYHVVVLKTITHSSLLGGDRILCVVDLNDTRYTVPSSFGNTVEPHTCLYLEEEVITVQFFNYADGERKLRLVNKP